VNSLSALGRLYEQQSFAMPRFVLGASPFVGPGDQPLLDVIRQVTVQHDHMASELADAILLRGGPLPKATYPTRYTSLHDLELRYLLNVILEEQRRIVRFVDELVHYLRDDEQAQRLARQVRRNETAHMRLFGELCLRYPIDDRHRRDHRSDSERQLETRIRGSNAARAAAASRHTDYDAHVAA
jgi:hypothetical protein